VAVKDAAGEAVTLLLADGDRDWVADARDAHPADPAVSLDTDGTGCPTPRTRGPRRRRSRPAA